MFAIFCVRALIMTYTILAILHLVGIFGGFSTLPPPYINNSFNLYRACIYLTRAHPSYRTPRMMILEKNYRLLCIL